jgi:Ca-activated chloride channel family protein
VTVRRRAGAVVAAALVASALVAGAQQVRPQTPTFRGAADLVSIYATVTDRDGRLVPDLTADDFVVRDDGREQSLAFFSSSLEPFSVVIMLDRSGTMEPHFATVRDAAIEFVRHMRPGDRARIGSFGDEIRLSPDRFTGDSRTLIRLLRTDLQGMGASPVWTAIDRAILSLLPEAGRRVVLVLSDGHDRPIHGQQATRLSDLMDRAKQADVMIYAIGFAATGAQYGGTWRRPGGTIFQPGGRRPSPWRPPPAVTTSVQPPDPALRDLASISGGGYFELGEDDDLNETFARVAEELHQQYWLGFVPSSLDGRVHDIEVDVRPRGLEVRARQTYRAGPER